MRIITREVDGAAVLEAVGRITLGEGSTLLRNTVRSIAAKGKRIVLDLSNAKYIDSSGIGELVSAFTSATNAGGSLVLCHPRCRVADLLAITKLATVYEVYSTIEEAVSGARTGTSRFICPVSGCDAWSPFDNRVDDQYHRCRRCGAKARFNSAVASIAEVRIPTYRGEYVAVFAGTPGVIDIVGRLDLFAANALKKAAWTAFAAVFDLTRTTEITERGRASLLRLVSEQSVILVPREKPFRRGDDNRAIYHDRTAAIEAHFAALRKSAEERHQEPTYGVTLRTRLLE
jgi:anti-sigma B factor antagonist